MQSCCNFLYRFKRRLARYLNIGFHAGECTIIIQKKQGNASGRLHSGSYTSAMAFTGMRLDISFQIQLSYWNRAPDKRVCAPVIQ